MKKDNKIRDYRSCQRMTEPVAGPAGPALVDGAAGALYSAPFLLPS
jgi:hypothetical protein